jgi:hypothetical protein
MLILIRLWWGRWGVAGRQANGGDRVLDCYILHCFAVRFKHMDR